MKAEGERKPEGSLLVPRMFSGAAVDYTLMEDRLLILDRRCTDTIRRRVEIPWEELSRFVSEIQEIESLNRLY